MTRRKAETLLVAAEAIMGGGPGPEWFEAMADTAEEAAAAFNRFQYLRGETHPGLE